MRVVMNAREKADTYSVDCNRLETIRYGKYLGVGDHSNCMDVLL